MLQKHHEHGDRAQAIESGNSVFHKPLFAKRLKSTKTSYGEKMRKKSQRAFDDFFSRLAFAHQCGRPCFVHQKPQNFPRVR
ncbi:hypothetical protein OKW34_000689 [Paraburkholderia youngii]|uniref:hypothetical protein n=1 Tax=Paraburkholderia youngii TaxID=2782701 RepID=UPI003D22684A